MNKLIITALAVLFPGCDIILGSKVHPSNPGPCKNVYTSEFGCLNNRYYVAYNLLHDPNIQEHLMLSRALRGDTFHVYMLDSLSGIVSIHTENGVVNMEWNYSITSIDSCSRIVGFPVFDPREQKYVMAVFDNRKNFASMNNGKSIRLYYSLYNDRYATVTYHIYLQCID